MLITILLFALFGLCWGSFLLVLVHRDSDIKSALTGRSRCDHCKRNLSWHELIPPVSYLITKGRCRSCRASLSLLYPGIELLTAVTFGLLVVRFGDVVVWWQLVLQCIFVSLLIMLCAYDWLHHAFPTKLLVYALVGAVVLALVSSSSRSIFTTSDPFFQWFVSPSNHLVSAGLGLMVGGGLLGIIAVGSREQWMGYGDVLLAGILGLWLGYPLILMGLVVAFYLGAIVGVGLLASNRARKDHHIAFGPFLILAAIGVQVWGEHLFYAIMKLWSIA